MEVLARRGVVPNCCIATDPRHVPVLALAAVTKDLSVVVPPVSVAILLSAGSGEEKDDGKPCGGAYAALPLTPLSLMQVPTADTRAGSNTDQD